MAIAMTFAADPRGHAPEPAADVDNSDSSLSDLLAAVEPGGRVVAMKRLKRSGRVIRATLIGGDRSSLVVKRVRRARARKTSLLSSRWLPAVGLEDRGPPLLASGPGPGGAVWQVFEDLGDCELLRDPPEAADVEAASRLVARFHLAFAGNGLLSECRDELGELGARFYGDWLGGAARALETIDPSDLLPDRLALRDRLSRRLEGLRAEEPERTRHLLEIGGPVTLLHGDLWPQNVLLPQARDRRLAARLIDWDHAVVGPVVYDLSTLIPRLSPRVRNLALRAYESALGSAGRRLPGPAELNEAFKTTEFARLAYCLIPLAESAGEGRDWAYEELGDVDRWFAALATAPGAMTLR